MNRSAPGFTLVELLVAILCSSIVTLAAMSFLLMGMRMTGESNDTAQRQQTARIILTMVENLAGSGQIKKVQSQGQNGWAVLGGSENSQILLYSAEKSAIVSGSGAVLMDGITESTTVWDSTQKLLSFTFKNEKAVYKTSVYCRMGVESNELNEQSADELIELALRSKSAPLAYAQNTPALQDPPTSESQSTQTDASVSAAQTERESRLALLSVLAEQHGSTGEIKNQTAGAAYRYFSEWYIGGYGDGKPGWNADTPWCACFVSWAAAQLGDTYLNTVPYFCNVDDGMERFQNGSIGAWHGRGYTPTPGDCIFFDWSGGDDPAHVGVVFYVDDPAGKLYTIEGNSGGQVAVRSYALDDPCILGYGVLNWK